MAESIRVPRFMYPFFHILGVVIFVPDMVFNYFVYTDGGKIQHASFLLAGAIMVFWAVVSIGLVGMTYLMAQVAQVRAAKKKYVSATGAILCVFGFTAWTTWASLAFRSQTYVSFKTDLWMQQVFPGLAKMNISITMIGAAAAPPLCGLLWSFLKPFDKQDKLATDQLDHASKIQAMIQEAEFIEAKREAEARKQLANVKKVAALAKGSREQAAQVFRKSEKKLVVGPTDDGQTQPSVLAVAPPLEIASHVIGDELIARPAPTVAEQFHQVVSEPISLPGIPWQEDARVTSSARRRKPSAMGSLYNIKQREEVTA